MALEVNAHWLLFGEPDNDLSIIKSAVGEVVIAILNDLKQDTKLAEDFGSSEWRMFTWETGDTRAREVVELINGRRKNALKDAISGIRTVRGEAIPLRLMTGE